MCRILFLLPLLPTSALADAGHIAELAGHSHYLGWGPVIAVAIVVAAIARSTGEDQESEQAEDEPVNDAN